MKTIYPIMALVLCSCASTNHTKTLITMGVMGAGGATVGAITAPINENAAAHALLWGGVAAAVAGAAGMFIFDEEKRSDALLRENETIKKTLDALHGASQSPVLLYETLAPLGKDIPSEYQSLVKPGRWSVYGLNQWILQGENVLIHQDKMMKLLPPEFNPNNGEKK